MKTLVVVLIATICTAIGESFLSFGMKQIGLENASFFRWFALVATNPIVLIGVFFAACFFFLYLLALSWADLSYVMPLTALSYLFAAVLAKVFLKEQISLLRWTGIIVIVIGTALVAMEEGRQRTAQAHTKTPRSVSLEDRGPESPMR